VPAIYYKSIKENITFIYLEKKALIKSELEENIATEGSFSLTLDAWTAINQDAYLGITM